MAVSIQYPGERGTREYPCLDVRRRQRQSPDGCGRHANRRSVSLRLLIDSSPNGGRDRIAIPADLFQADLAIGRWDWTLS